MRAPKKRQAAGSPTRSQRRAAHPPAATAPDAATSSAHKKLDQELDQELDDTFPASDPLPWSHEVK